MGTGRGRVRTALGAAGLLLAGVVAGCTSEGEGGEDGPGSSGGDAERQPYEEYSGDGFSPFGMVKGGVGDAVIAPTWVKTIWTPQVLDGTDVDADAWRSLLEGTRRHDQIEVPVVADDVWKSGDIGDIERVMRQFFEADPRVPAWEMGLEENLREGWVESLPETAEKLAAVRKVKDSVNPDIKLVYQLVDTTGEPLETFLESDASDYVDVIAIHPYAWPDFETPELWLDRFLTKAEELMAEHDKDLPIWFTEVGAPTDEPGLQLYSGPRPVYGLTPEEQADYLAKVYATGLNRGVERIFWYEYQDSCSGSPDVECYFGLKYEDGTPKPAYDAYAAMSDCVSGKDPAGGRERGDVRIWSFEGSKEDCHVVWVYPESEATLPLTAVSARPQQTQAFDVTGDPVSLSDGEVPVSGSPVFLVVSR